MTRPAAPASRGARSVVRIVALALLIATGALVLLGSTVRVTESGMGCASWPLCNGSIGPIDHFHALLEQSHRYLAAVVTVGVAALFVLARRSANRALRRWAGVAIAIIAVQVGLGAVTVLTHNAPATVAAHLVVGLLLLAATALMAAASFGMGERSRPCGALEVAALSSTLVLLVSGSIVVDGGASAACPSWPWCGPHPGAPWHLVTLQLVHRAAVAVTACVLVTLAVRRRRVPGTDAATRALATSVLALLAAQVGVGALDALTRAPDALQDVHVGLAGAIWCLVAVLVLAGGRLFGPERELPRYRARSADRTGVGARPGGNSRSPTVR